MKLSRQRWSLGQDVGDREGRSRGLAGSMDCRRKMHDVAWVRQRMIGQITNREANSVTMVLLGGSFIVRPNLLRQAMSLLHTNHQQQ